MENPRPSHHPIRLLSFLPRLPLLPLTSLAFAILLTFLLLDAPRRSHVLGLFTPQAHLQALASDRTGLLFLFSSLPFEPRSALSAQTCSVPADPAQQFHNFLFDPTRRHPLGFHFATGALPLSKFQTPRFAALLIPYWLLLPLSLLLPVRSLYRTLVRSRRRKHGQCPYCGYDLRTTPTQCPECGVSPTAPPRAPSRRRLALRLSAVTITTLFALTLFWRGARAQSPDYEDPTYAALLSRPVPNISLDHVTYAQALNALQEATGVRISIDSTWGNPSAGSLRVELHDVTLGDALEAVLAPTVPHVIQTYRNAVAIRVPGKGPSYLGIYSVQDVLRHFHPGFSRLSDPRGHMLYAWNSDAGQTSDLFRALVSSDDMSATLPRTIGTRDFQIYEGSVLVVGTGSHHHELRATIRMLRAEIGKRSAGIETPLSPTDRPVKEFHITGNLSSSV